MGGGHSKKSRATRHEEKEYHTDVPDAQNLPAFKLPPKDFKGGKFYYGVRIVTGSEEGAGGNCDKDVYVKLIGNNAESGKVKLSDIFTEMEGSFMKKKYDDFVIECDENLGNVLVVIVGNGRNFVQFEDACWHVDFVIVHDFQLRTDQDFPCYHWIGPGDYVSFTAHTTTANSKEVEDHPVLQEQRKKQLEQRRELYQWKMYPHGALPSCIDTSVLHLPPDEKFERVKNVDFTEDAVKAVGTFGLNYGFESVDGLDDYQRMAKLLCHPEVPVYVAARWETDVEFGRQMMNGVNPVVISKCSSLPINFHVTNEMVKGFFHRDLTLEEEMKAGHIYICNLKIMEGLPCRKGYYCCAPMCLLYVNGSNQLVPIAIQLKQQPGDDNPIFLPSDHLLDWLLAKIYYQSAHSQFHQLSTHYQSCHAAMEAYSMATMRNLPDPHPIYKLLRPHYRYTMAINARARETLINKGGIIDRMFSIGGEGKEELFSRAFAAYSVHWTNIKRSVKERGVDNAEELPGYYYRDDGLKVWQAIENYARDIIDLYYTSDEDVKNDPELQQWAQEMHTTAFPAFRDAPSGHGFPDKIETREELVELCTLIMFTGSAQHAAVNFGQYFIYGYVPNAPFGMRRPPPTRKGVTDFQMLLDSLPDKFTTIGSIGVSYLLSQFNESDIYLGNYPYDRFTEEPAKRLASRFKVVLEDITADILERNKSLDVPYKYLLRGRVPNSITI